MSSYVGPAQLLFLDRTLDVEVNLHEFVDLADHPRARWRGVVVNASFEPVVAPDARLRIPGVGEAPAMVAERRLLGEGSLAFA